MTARSTGVQCRCRNLMFHKTSWNNS